MQRGSETQQSVDAPAILSHVQAAIHDIDELQERHRQHAAAIAELCERYRHLEQQTESDTETDSESTKLTTSEGGTSDTAPEDTSTLTADETGGLLFLPLENRRLCKTWRSSAARVVPMLKDSGFPAASHAIKEWLVDLEDLNSDDYRAIESRVRDPDFIRNELETAQRVRDALGIVDEQLSVPHPMDAAAQGGNCGGPIEVTIVQQNNFEQDNRETTINMSHNESKTEHHFHETVVAEEQGLTDDESFVPASTLWQQRFSEYKKFKRALDQIPESVIRRRKPSPQRLEVHAGDWAKHWHRVDQEEFESLDEESHSAKLADAAAKVRQQRK